MSYYGACLVTVNKQLQHLSGSMALLEMIVNSVEELRSSHNLPSKMYAIGGGRLRFCSVNPLLQEHQNEYKVGLPSG